MARTPRQLRVAGLVAAVLAITVVAFSGVGRAGGVDRGATAFAPAVQIGAEQVVPLPSRPSVASPALTGCDADVLQRLVASDPSVAQWIMVSVANATDTTGTLMIATVQRNTWVCSLPSTPAEVGRQGVRPLLLRRSGDDTTPAGVFPLGVVATPQGPISFFGNSADPGVHGPYRHVQPGDCYGANPGTPGYGHWRTDPNGCVGDDELLIRNTVAYEYAVLIGANTEPSVSGDAPGEIPYAAAIFLHRNTLSSGGAAKPTSGCVSVGHDALLTAMRVIDPLLLPHFAIGTQADLLATAPRPTLPQR